MRQAYRVSSSGAGLSRAAALLEAFCEQHAIDGVSAWQFLVALDEVLSNVVGHAYADNPDGAIDLEFAIVDGELEMTIVDDGPPFDILSLPEPDTTSTLADRPVGGLGVHFIRSFMNRVSYMRVEGRNRLVLARRVSP